MHRRFADGGSGAGHLIAQFNSPGTRSAVWQLLLLALVLWLGYAFVHNAQVNLATQGITSGFGFLQQGAGFGVNQSLIPYDETSSYGRVFWVGLLNTLLVAAIGIVLATLIGFAVGIARLSPNWLLARLAGGYVELLRNLPLLFQLLFWYLAVLGTLPGPRQSLALGWQQVAAGLADAGAWLGAPDGMVEACRALAAWIGPPEIYLNNRGLMLPRLLFGAGIELVLLASALAIMAALTLRAWARRRQATSGAKFPLVWASVLLLVGIPLAVLAFTGFPLGLEPPQLRGFNFVGGVRVIPEFMALLIGLSTYTAAFIAEVVRGGILAVGRGQSEAALALGLRPGQTLRLVVLPQALRVIVPPLTNQYLNLTKNSSLAVAIGYPDLFAVFAGTTLNQTLQAIETIAITMAVYLVISLATSAAMNFYNARLQLKER
jgi:general L-amino acid transport system permease protein